MTNKAIMIYDRSYEIDVIERKHRYNRGHSDRIRSREDERSTDGLRGGGVIAESACR